MNRGAENRGDTHYWKYGMGRSHFLIIRSISSDSARSLGSSLFHQKRQYIPIQNRRIEIFSSPVMESHQKNDAANGKMLYYLAENFRYPKDFESLLYVTQVLQAVAIKSGVEHWRRNRGRCMQPCTGRSMITSCVASHSALIITADGKRFITWHADSMEPVAGSIVRIADTDTAERNGGEHFSAVAAHVQNETAQPVGGIRDYDSEDLLISKS